jgi:hypothetical protein
VTKFKIKAKAEDAQKAGEDAGDFVLPPAGYYHLKIVEANAGFSTTDGEEDKTKPRIEVVYEIDAVGMDGAGEVTENYGRIWDYITFGDGYAGTRRTEFAVAMGADKDAIANGAEVTLDTDELLERKLIARLKHEKDKRKSEELKKTVMRARVATVLPLSAADGAVADGGEVDFGGDDEAAAVDEDPFADNPPDEDVGDGLLTEEELDAMEPKDISATAKEFDLDPQSLIVKYTSGANKGKVNVPASKKAMIEAILEAQGGSPEEPAGEDGDPF